MCAHIHARACVLKKTRIKLETIKKFTPSKTDGKLDAQKFFDFTLSAVRDMMNDELILLKREIKDLNTMVKLLRNRNKDLELEFKAIGIAMSQLGVTEINLLNDTKNMIRDKISVLDSQGRVKGRVDVHRYNLVPATELNS